MFVKLKLNVFLYGVSAFIVAITIYDVIRSYKFCNL